MTMTQNLRNQKVTIFAHVPKSGGGTLSKIIIRQYKPDEILKIRGLCSTAIDKLKTTPLEVKGKIKFLRGHVPFGIHNSLNRPYTYITLLRDPVDRVISHFYWMAGRNPSFKDSVGSLEKLIDKGFSISEEFEQVRLYSDNAHLRILSGIELSVPFGQCTGQHLEDAKRNLDNYFSVVGLTEEFDETLILLSKALGWRKLRYSRSHVTQKRPKKNDLSEDLLKRVASLNELDIELYEYARNIFDNQKRQYILFGTQVRSFKLVNDLKRQLPI